MRFKTLFCTTLLNLISKGHSFVQTQMLPGHQEYCQWLQQATRMGFDLVPFFSGHIHMYNKMCISFQHHLWCLSFWETTVHRRNRMFVFMLWVGFQDSAKNWLNLWLKAKIKIYNTLVNCRDRFCAMITVLIFVTSLI